MRREGNACGTLFTQVAVTELPRSVGPVVSCQCGIASSHYFFIITFFTAPFPLFILFYFTSPLTIFSSFLGWNLTSFYISFSYLILHYPLINHFHLENKTWQVAKKKVGLFRYFLGINGLKVIWIDISRY